MKGLIIMNQNKVTGVLKRHLVWPLILIPLLVIMTVHLLITDITSGIYAAVYVLVYSVIALILYYFNKRAVMANIINYAMSYNKFNKLLMEELDLPTAYLDASGSLIWYNNAFFNVAGDNAELTKHISLIFSNISKDCFPICSPDSEADASLAQKEYLFSFGDRFFRAVLNQTSIHNYDFADDIENLSLFDGSDTIVSLHLYDESQLNEYREMIEDEDIIMGLLYIDDYEESLRDCEELQRSLLTALIERQIAKNMQMIDGVYKKMEKDRYFIIFRHKYLQVLKENKFKILEDVRNVKVANNDVHLTISIGLGVHADSYTKKYDYARAAIDLAIGRGGDQAVIKDGEDINYYGGNNLQKDINTRVRARVKANALNELIVSADQTYIMGHIGCDIDSFGAAVGIYSIARNLKRTAKIVLAHDDRASIQATLDEYKNKSDYNGFIIDKNEAIYNITADTLLVIVDVNKPSLVECPELLTMTHNIVVIDHHRQTGDRIKNQILSYIEPFASSTSEMVTEFFQYINGGIRPNSLEADTLYSGIMVDTNNFTVQTSPRTFEAVTYLRRSSNDISRIRKRFRCDPEEYMTRAQAISNAKVFADYYAITTVPSNATGNIPVIGAKVANSLLEMKNIKASFVLSEYKSRIQISARSIDDANVQLIMEKLGGGGHSTVAAAQLDMSLSEAVAALKEVITNMIKEGDLK